MSDGFGKVFAGLYKGSMIGAGPYVFSLWPYCLASCDSKGFVEVNPRLAAYVIGCSTHEIETALEYLQRPDPESRSKEEDGRRLVREGQFLYRIVNYAAYRVRRDEDARREYQRLWDRANRPSGSARGKADDGAPEDEAQALPTRSDVVRHGPTRSDKVRPDPTHAEAEAEAEEEKEQESPFAPPETPKRPGPSAPRPAIAGPSPADLVRIWNENRGTLPAVSKLTDGRKKHARARLADVPDLEVWAGVVRKLAACPFTRGENDRAWVADFDYFLRPDTIVKAAEGKYDRKPSPPGKPLPGAHYAKPAETPISAPVRVLTPPPPTPDGPGNVWGTLLPDVELAVMDARNFDVWISGLRQAGEVNGALVLVAANRDTARVIIEDYLPILADVARDHGIEVPIRFVTEAGEEVSE